MDKIDFAYNWNGKLNCTSFTTLRLQNDKYIVGQSYEVFLKKEKIFTVKVLAIKNILLENINEFIARLDTGYSREECIALIRTMYKNKNINWNTQKLSLILLIKI